LKKYRKVLIVEERKGLLQHPYGKTSRKQWMTKVEEFVAREVRIHCRYEMGLPFHVLETIRVDMWNIWA